MSGRRQGHPVARALWVVAVVGFVAAMLWACGSVMRERDQAALLDGSIQIARDGVLAERAYYNYDKQYASYWLVSGVLKALGLHEAGAHPDHVVSAGNWTAALAVGMALLLAGGSCGLGRWSSLWPGLVALFTPVLALSAPLLSTNMLSLAALLVLTVSLRRGGTGWSGAVTCGLLAWLAVAFRRDAALLLPALCFLSTPRLSVRGLAAEPRHWAMLLGAVVAVVTGNALYSGPDYDPTRFLDWRLLGAYSVFGLAGALILIGWLVLRIGTAAVRRRKFALAAGAAALLAPLGFYVTVLTSPRHFTLTAVALLCVALLPRGRAWWRLLWRNRLDRMVIAGAVALSAVLWVAGLNFRSLTSFRVAVGEATRFPTADGFWPAGAYAAFFGALAGANKKPVDHNQEVWAGWKALDMEALPEGTARVHSLGLRAVGNLAMRVHGREATAQEERWDYILVPFRTVGRTEAGFHGIKTRNPVPDWSRCWLEALPGDPERRIYLANPEGAVGRQKPLELEWIARLLVLKAFSGDNVYMVRPEDAARLDSAPQHRIGVVFDRPGAPREFARRLEAAGLEPEIVEFDGDPATGSVVMFFPSVKTEWSALLPEEGAVWLAQAVLPIYMSKSRFPVSQKR